MRALVIHAPKDLRVEAVDVPRLGPRDVEVRVEAGGICGSDLHYYHHGGFGTVRLKQPMILGHEIAGRVEAVGTEVSRVKPGDRVAVNPSRPCLTCSYCTAGQHNHCLDMRFYGSAMRLPHIQGGFCDRLVVEERQAVPVPEGVSASEAAFAEPLAVCLHAASRAGDLLGRSVLVTGCGPIGALTIVVARHAGAAEIVATDIADAPLAIAPRLGATGTVNVAADPGAMQAFAADKGRFDVMFEASGNAAALAGAFAGVKPRGIIVQIGQAGEVTIPMNVLVAKEFDLRGSFRFHPEFERAAGLIASRRVDLSPLLTATLPLEQARAAFDLASDRARAMKVQLSFG